MVMVSQAKGAFGLQFLFNAVLGDMAFFATPKTLNKSVFLILISQGALEVATCPLSFLYLLTLFLLFLFIQLSFLLSLLFLLLGDSLGQLFLSNFLCPLFEMHITHILSCLLAFQLIAKCNASLRMLHRVFKTCLLNHQRLQMKQVPVWQILNPFQFLHIKGIVFLNLVLYVGQAVSSFFNGLIMILILLILRGDNQLGWNEILLLFALLFLMELGLFGFDLSFTTATHLNTIVDIYKQSFTIIIYQSNIIDIEGNTFLIKEYSIKEVLHSNCPKLKFNHNQLSSHSLT